MHIEKGQPNEFPVNTLNVVQVLTCMYVADSGKKSYYDISLATFLLPLISPLPMFLLISL